MKALLKTTFRVEDIIYNATLDTIYHKLEIARLVSRKVTYLWLGNAFSPFPWSYLWIGESLCTLLSMEALTQVLQISHFFFNCFLKVLQY
ncbi:Aminopeptidase-like protein AC3.5 [Ooceraea biroi]|uniref:Aminopeptidase-like protein AC3.5 n=1 Tax=Ooceraea biroi TaxID=2015173 RepID=A0A026VZX3_OOCBI|nr:Aminopeptidase-like protein AC3.5 [Ooceraea biroi]